MSSPFRFAIRVKPGARKDAVGGVWRGSSGDAVIVAVSAPAIEGKANDAVRKVVAGAFGVRTRDVSIVAGDRGRDKLIELDPAPADAPRRLDALLGR